jgi:GxxExxY protein
MVYLHSEITGEILNAFYDVYNELGYGFLERVYKNALYKELKKRGFDCSTERSIPVYYQGELVGDYYAGIIIEDKIIIELKAIKQILPEHEAQLMNYLRATDAEVGLLLNFGPTPQKRRIVFTNDRKKNHMNTLI